MASRVESRSAGTKLCHSSVHATGRAYTQADEDTNSATAAAGQCEQTVDTERHIMKIAFYKDRYTIDTSLKPGFSCCNSSIASSGDITRKRRVMREGTMNDLFFVFYNTNQLHIRILRDI